MSFSSMAKELAQGAIPGLSIAYAKTTLNEALKDIYDSTDWSWQTGQSGWLVPTLIANGTVTVTPYSTAVVADAVATAQWAALTGRPLLTELQFRNPSWALYNIVQYLAGSNPSNPNNPYATLTLDRPWMEPVTGSGQPYQIYQAYFPVPVADFTKFIEIADTLNQSPVSFTRFSQDDLSAIDPKRLMFGPTVPEYAVPWGTDTRVAPDGTLSPTYGYIMYELWPHVLSQVPYAFSYKRSGPLLVNPTDTPLYPITEECIKWRAKEILYQWKEAQKGEQMERGMGANWQFLAQAAGAEHKQKLKQCRLLDANLHRDFVTHPRRDGAVTSDGYSTNRTGQLNVGTFAR